MIVADCTVYECARSAKEVNAKKLVLVHLYPDVSDQELIKAAQNKFKGEIISGIKLYSES